MPDKELYSYSFHFFGAKQKQIVELSLEEYLKRIDKNHLFVSLSYILDEIAGNATKANFKRIHFRRRNLDIAKEQDYKEGLEDFQEILSSETDTFFSLSEKLGYYVKIDMREENGVFILSVSNNSGLLPQEKSRILDKFHKAKRFNNLEEVMNSVLDPSEGAGFGIILMILTLRKIGLDERMIEIRSNNKTTSFRVKIPITLLSEKERTLIADEILREIKDIPQFPQHILELQRLLSSPSADFSKLAKIIERDPTLIADLLKTANSVIYALPQKVSHIKDAVKMIGFKGVKNLILSYTTKNLLMSRYKLKEIKEVMNHSNEVAYYAHRIARLFKIKGIVDDLYISAIIHDIGKIIVYAIQPNILKQIEKACLVKGLKQEVLDNLTSGYNHSLIGAKLAEKWNFPEDLVQVIQFHHIPLQADDEYSNLVTVIYLANILYYYRRNKFEYENINYTILERLNLEKKSQWTAFSDKILGQIHQEKDSAFAL